MMTYHTYKLFLYVMLILAAIVFVALFFVKAGYGVFRTKKWGLAINNKVAWILMESPVFFLMLFLFLHSERTTSVTLLVFFLIFQSHYFQRSFIFPLLIKGHSKMSVVIMLMGVVFNVLNALMQGLYFFYLCDPNLYTTHWLTTPQFIIGTLIFYVGMYININADKRIRGLRKNGDTKHYLPTGGLFNYVTSANYLGELTQWVGFAILTWSFPALVFAIWTFANLVPRSDAIYHYYQKEFAQEMGTKKLKRIFPFIY